MALIDGEKLISTFLTLLYVPIFYTLFEDAVQGVKRLWSSKETRLKGSINESENHPD